MKISKEMLEQEVLIYNKIVEEIQKQNIIINELEQKRLKSYGKLEFIESLLKDEPVELKEAVKEISIDEILKPPSKKKKS